MTALPAPTDPQPILCEVLAINEVLGADATSRPLPRGEEVISRLPTAGPAATAADPLAPPSAALPPGGTATSRPPADWPDAHSRSPTDALDALETSDEKIDSTNLAWARGLLASGDSFMSCRHG